MSMSKPLTAVGVMILVDEGRVSLIDPVEKYLPDSRGLVLGNGGKPKRPVSVRDLLTHSGGLTNPPSVSDSPHITLSEAVKMVAKKPL